MTARLTRILIIATAVAAAGLGSSMTAAADPPALAFHAVTGGWSSEAYRSGAAPVGLEYAEQPWLTDQDIAAWDLSSHWIYLKRDKRELLERFGATPAAGPGREKPFVILVRGEVCLVAEFHSGVDGRNRPFPHFDAISLGYQPDDVIVLNRGTGEQDDRLRPCLVEVLQELGLARMGLGVAIENVWVSHPPGRNHAMTECEISLTNRGTEDLMIPDPSRLGDQFYYLGWGLRLTSRDDPKRAIYRPVDGLMAGGLRHQNYLVLLPAGATIHRTLVKATDRVPPGVYVCEFEFPGMPGNSRSAGGISIWHGVVPAAPVEIVVGE